MKINTVISGILLFLTLGCGVDSVSTEILKTHADKEAFLEKILEEDQKVRDGKDAELMLKYGKDSKEHMEYVKAQWKQDEINLNKIETYLEKFGYPTKKEFSQDGVTAPWMVIHHNTDLEKRNRNFETLYKAYLAEDIEDTAMSFYLGRTYSFTFGERFKIESPFKSEDEINQLIKALNLEEKKANVLRELKQE